MVQEMTNFIEQLCMADGISGREEQVRLKACCDALTARGVKFLLSNSATPFIRELYGSYRVSIVQARRAVNSVASRRGAIEEVLVRNYGT